MKCEIKGRVIKQFASILVASLRRCTSAIFRRFPGSRDHVMSRRFQRQNILVVVGLPRFSLEVMTMKMIKFIIVCHSRFFYPVYFCVFYLGPHTYNASLIHAVQCACIAVFLCFMANKTAVIMTINTTLCARPLLLFVVVFKIECSQHEDDRHLLPC